MSDTTLRFDRTRKASLYARAGIQDYWILNLVDTQVEVHTNPSGAIPAAGYGQRQVFGPADAVPLVLLGQEAARIPAQDLLP